MAQGARMARIEDIPPVADHGLPIDAEWRPVRHHLGVDAFGVNAYVARDAGEVVIEDHDEGDTRHQELYLVVRGRAEFTLGDRTEEAPAGSFCFFPEPNERRKAVALEPGTTVVAVGARPGAVFSPTPWETRRTRDLPTVG